MPTYRASLVRVFMIGVKDAGTACHSFLSEPMVWTKTVSVTMSDVTDVARHYITTGITRYADEAVARHPTCCIAKL